MQVLDGSESKSKSIKNIKYPDSAINFFAYFIIYIVKISYKTIEWCQWHDRICLVFLKFTLWKALEKGAARQKI